jgi:hypothetical protein
MAKQESDVVGKFALVVTIVGLGGYLVLSSGLFSKSSSDTEKASENTLDPQAKVKEWRQELNQISQESLEKQKELEDLTARLAKIRLEVQKRDADLGRNLGKDNSRRRNLDMPKGKFASILDLKRYLLEFSDETFDFTQKAGRDGQMYQYVSMQKPFAEDSVFLRRVGLKWARAVSKAATDLQARDLIIRYGEGDGPFEKAQVLQSYLQEIMEATAADGEGGATRIALQAVLNDEVISESQVDLLLAFEESVQRGER